MTTNEGVGKKIVEALKKQSDPDYDLTQDYPEVQDNNDVKRPEDTVINNEINEIDASDINQLYGTPYNTDENRMNDINTETYEIKEKQIVTENSNIQNMRDYDVFGNTISPMPQQPQGWNFGINEGIKPSYKQSQFSTNTSAAKQFEMPPNVAVLKRLITQLPTGVTKQTGAQIIKQTMEALGISMNTVLQEAQKVQDDMNESIKSCMLSIQEYKNNIKNLEKQGLDYQRQVNQLNDLISLFILSDKD